jgi:hypothetical protein
LHKLDVVGNAVAIMNRKSFILKHWGATLGLAPVIVGIYETLIERNMSPLEFLVYYPLYLLFGFLFSMPALLLYYLLFHVLATKQLSTLVQKLILISFSVFSIAFAFWLIKGKAVFELGIIYSIAAIFSGCILKLKSRKEALPTTTATMQ